MAGEATRPEPPAEDGIYSVAGERLDDDRERLRASRAEVEPLFRQGGSRRDDGRDPRADAGEPTEQVT